MSPSLRSPWLFVVLAFVAGAAVASGAWTAFPPSHAPLPVAARPDPASTPDDLAKANENLTASLHACDRKLAEREATATSLAAIGITALAGVVVYSLRGEVQPEYAALVGVPAAGGALVGTWLQQRVTGEALTYGFAALLVAVGSWLLVS